jgi:hypothetical protein
MRYQSGVEMKSDLENLDKVEVTHRDQRLRAPQPWKSRSTTALLVAGFILLQIALFVVIFLLARRHR